MSEGFPQVTQGPAGLAEPILKLPQPLIAQALPGARLLAAPDNVPNEEKQDGGEHQRCNLYVPVLESPVQRICFLVWAV